MKKIKIIKSPDIKNTLLSLNKGETVQVMYSELKIGSVRAVASRLKKVVGDSFDVQAPDNASYYTITRRA